MAASARNPSRQPRSSTESGSPIWSRARSAPASAHESLARPIGAQAVGINTPQASLLAGAALTGMGGVTAPLGAPAPPPRSGSAPHHRRLRAGAGSELLPGHGHRADR